MLTYIDAYKMTQKVRSETSLGISEWAATNLHGALAEVEQGIRERASLGEYNLTYPIHRAVSLGDVDKIDEKRQRLGALLVTVLRCRGFRARLNKFNQWEVQVSWGAETLLEKIS